MPTVGEMAHVTLPKEQRDKIEADIAAEAAQREADLAKSLGETTTRQRTLPAPHPGFGVLLDSVKLNLRVAFEHGTSVTNKELWPRCDFSALPEQPGFDAFCSWLRHKVDEGILSSRIENDAERLVRVEGETGRYNRHAALYALESLTDTPPEVTKKYQEYEPLTEQQQAWLTEHPPVRRQFYKKKADREREEQEAAAVQTPEQAEQVRADVERRIAAGQAGAAAAGREMGMEMRRRKDAGAEPKVDGRTKHGRAARAASRAEKQAAAALEPVGTEQDVAVFDMELGHQLQKRVRELEAENAQMRTAFHHFGMGLAALTAPIQAEGTN